MTTPQGDSREYRAEDRAILLRFYQRLLWNRLVAALPRRLTPNTITLTGEACALLAAPCAWAASHGHPFVYLASGALLFAYMTGDNIDGQHARRTGQTSALGEFLDHGLDGLASPAILFCSAFALHLDGVWLAALLALGSLGFGAVFWAQYRTGVLVTPRISAMEGVTGASIFQFAVLAAGEPTWLRFAPRTLNAASVLLAALAISYAYAIASPLLRAARAGAKLGELAAPLAYAAAAVVYPLCPLAGARGAIDTSVATGVPAAIVVAVYVADAVCRMILLRRRGSRATFVSPFDVVALLPLGAALAGVVRADWCAWLSAAIVFARYARTFGAGCVEIARAARGTVARAS